MKHDKLFFFEVGRNMSKYLSCSLGLYLVFQGLVEVGDFVGLARVSSGPLLYGVSRITQSGVGHFLLMLLTTGLLVSIYECFRRSLSKVKSLLSYVVLAIITLMVCDFLVSLSPDSTTDMFQQVHNPSRFASFSIRFRNVSSLLQSLLSFILSIALIVKYRGRIAAYGWVNVACMLLSGAGIGYLYTFLANNNVDFLNRGMAFAWTAFRYVVGILPVVFLRRTLVHRDIKESKNEDDI